MIDLNVRQKNFIQNFFLCKRGVQEKKRGKFFYILKLQGEKLDVRNFVFQKLLKTCGSCNDLSHSKFFQKNKKLEIGLAYLYLNNSM